MFARPRTDVHHVPCLPSVLLSDHSSCGWPHASASAGARVAVDGRDAGHLNPGDGILIRIHPYPVPRCVVLPLCGVCCGGHRKLILVLSLVDWHVTMHTAVVTLDSDGGEAHWLSQIAACLYWNKKKVVLKASASRGDLQEAQGETPA